VLLFFAIAIIATTDRLTKTLALMKSASVSVLPAGLLSFEPGINKFGPLGITVPYYLFFILAVVLLIVLGGLFWHETSSVNRALLLGIIFGIVSNSYDRMRFGYIIDVFRLAGGLSFNLADVLIVFGVVVILIRYRWPKQMAKATRTE